MNRSYPQVKINWITLIHMLIMTMPAVLSIKNCNVCRDDCVHVPIDHCYCVHKTEHHITRKYDSWYNRYTEFVGAIKKSYTNCYYVQNDSILDEDTCNEDVCEYITFSSSAFSTIPINFFRKTPYVKEIYLNRSGIENIQVGAFSGLLNLEILQLENNELTKLGEGSLNNLETLKTLDMHNNKLITIENDAFLGLNSLSSLDLSKNQLNSISYNLLKHLTELKTLILSHNYLSVINFNINMLNQLETLYLNNNGIEDVVDCFNETSLVQLFLQDNAISHFNESCFPSSLTFLDLANNNVSSLDFLDNLNLKTLILSKNRLNEISIDTFKNMGMLQKLDLSLNQIGVIETGTFSETQNIEYLNLSAINLDYLKPHVLIPLNSLISLDISDNNLTYLDPQLFLHFDSFRTLYVQGNNFTCEVVSSIFRESKIRNFTLDYKADYSAENIKGLICHNGVNKNFEEYSLTIFNWTNLMTYLKNISGKIENLEGAFQSEKSSMKKIEIYSSKKNEAFLKYLEILNNSILTEFSKIKNDLDFYTNISENIGSEATDTIQNNRLVMNYSTQDINKSFMDSWNQLKMWIIFGSLIFPCVYVIAKISSCFFTTKKRSRSFNLGQEMPILS